MDHTPPRDTAVSLRDRTVSGGMHLAMRQVAGLAVRSVGLLLLTRYIGPGNYGIYAASVAIATVVASVCRFGTEVYLTRLRAAPVGPHEEQVFSFLVTAAAAALAIALPVILLFREVFDIEGTMVLFVLLALTPVNVLWVPAQARLERDLRYRSLARIEFTGDLVLYGVAIGVAAAGAGVWAPVAGYALWQTWLLVASYRSSGFRPRWRWEWSLLREVLRYGSTYSPSFWATRLRDVMNPLVVGRYVGAVGVGYVALALRLTENLSFVRRTVNQIAVPALARVQDDRDRVERAHAEAMLIKVIGVGVPFLGVALTMPVVLPPLLGSDWEGVATVFPLIAVSALVGGPLALNQKVLHVVGRNGVVAVAQVLSLAVLAVLSAVLVPELGPDGFGWATIGAFFPLLILDPAVRPVLTPHYGPAIRWSIALVPPMFIPLLHGPAAVLLAVPTASTLLLPSSWRDMRHVAGLLRRVLRPGTRP